MALHVIHSDCFVMESYLERHNRGTHIWILFTCVNVLLLDCETAIHQMEFYFKRLFNAMVYANNSITILWNIHHLKENQMCSKMSCDLAVEKDNDILFIYGVSWSFIS